MNIAEKLTQQDFQELLIKIYKKGQESKDIEVVDLIEEIKQHIISVCSSKEMH